TGRPKVIKFTYHVSRITHYASRFRHHLPVMPPKCPVRCLVCQMCDAAIFGIDILTVQAAANLQPFCVSGMEANLVPARDSDVFRKKKRRRTHCCFALPQQAFVELWYSFEKHRRMPLDAFFDVERLKNCDIHLTKEQVRKDES